MEALTAVKVLLIVTSHSQFGSTGEKTGFWLEELAAPYEQFTKAGAQVDIASPLGGKAPVDPRSEKEATEDTRAFLADAEATKKLANTKVLAQVKDTYDAYFVVGGHGVMWDLSQHAPAHQLLSAGYARGAVVAAVCHGPAALVGVKGPDGKPLVAGKRVAAFSNAEEQAAKFDAIVPFALETRMRELGARYESGPLWKSFTVRDGRLVTGQNPASSAATAQEVLNVLREKKTPAPKG
ncbi:type 1 glutamine amidotransferase domain-containing protein [Corallococcus carmarthensis]|uniref:Type 1 glutamine amidotransferase domain-containing protein n=1 Tax=Corallococcus carmarthensis TaxID=2316728 RepID=A0A3A8KH47_9BACT|nr:type 1 glutamine amidotransferase domain-containing protein [Corallococcus carmarthensis]NOK18443.1 type 1 glutamine amidotransferase domain-containing protein [Corallococcus carmarthensis]RKH01772.1 type 1 glutamine amidotransferase domain-containing protein [Corallococcus carmarthensis]